MDAFSVYGVAKERQSRFSKLALVPVECHSCDFYALEDGINILVVFCCVSAEDKDIIYLA